MKTSSPDGNFLSTIGSNILTLGLLLYVIAALDHKFGLFETEESRNMTLYIVSGVYAAGFLCFSLFFKAKKEDKKGESQ